MNDRQQALLDAARPLPIDQIIDLAGVCRKPGETDAELRARVLDGVRPIPMAIHTIKDAIAATEQGLASCYGRDEQGGDWVGFGRPRRTGHIPRVYLPASAAAVEGCQHVQRRYLRHRCRAPEGQRPANDAEHDGGEGPREASVPLVLAELQKACNAYPSLNNARPVFEHRSFWVRLSESPYDRVACAITLDVRSTHQAMLYQCRASAEHVAKHWDSRPCGVCKGAYSLLCHACKGGVGP